MEGKKFYITNLILLLLAIGITSFLTWVLMQIKDIVDFLIVLILLIGFNVGIILGIYGFIINRRQQRKETTPILIETPQKKAEKKYIKDKKKLDWFAIIMRIFLVLILIEIPLLFLIFGNIATRIIFLRYFLPIYISLLILVIIIYRDKKKQK